MFQYLEERPLGAASGIRRKNVAAVDDPIGTTAQIPNWKHSLYTWSNAYALEGRESVAETEGVWLLSELRVRRHSGDPGHEQWPHQKRVYPPNVEAIHDAPSVRIHHYFRVFSAIGCRRVDQARGTVAVGIEVTEEWHNPIDGIISSIPPSSPVLGSHCIGLQWSSLDEMFTFRNSWGKEWGHNGRGKISPDLIDRYLVESWAMVGVALFPPLNARSGLVVLLWKSADGGQEVHGREIIDATSGERIGWCLLVRRGHVLDIEELFVWPSHRHHGYGRVLVDLALELARQMRVKLRILVSYADAGPLNRPALIRIVDLCGLHMHPSTIKGVAFLGLQEQFAGDLQEPKIPEPPASIRDRLNPANGTRLYTVWFGTNRKPIEPDDATKGFSSQRDGKTHYGLCRVSIPKTHRFGSTGSAWWKRWLRCTDDSLQVTERVGFVFTEFWRNLAENLRECDIDEQVGLVFLHGYNVDFDEAAIRAAQIGFDLKVPGVTAFFSWPSCGTLLGYPTDESCIEASEPFIADFLQDFVSRSGVKQVHIIAHSMGSRGLVRALQRLAMKLSTETDVPFGQLIVAAPDIDADTFAGLSGLFPLFSQRTTLYASPADRAIAASQWLHGYPRAGLTPHVTVVAGVDTVEVPNFNLFELLGHGYYAESEGLLHDIFDLLHMNMAPTKRQRLALAQTPGGLDYWVMSP